MEVESWFEEEVYRKRVTTASIWVTAIHILLAVSAALLLTFIQAPLHPLAAVAATVKAVLSPSSWLIFLLVGLTAVWSVKIQARLARIRPSVERSVLANLSASLEPAGLSTLGYIIGISTLMSWCWLRLADTPYSSMRHSGGSGWNSGHFLLLLAGGFYGVIWWKKMYVGNGAYLSLPIIPLDIVTQIRLRLYPSLFSRAPLLSTLHTVKYFYVVYIIGLLLLRESVTSLLVSETGLLQLVSPSLILSVVCLSFVLQASGTAVGVVVGVYCTLPLPQLGLQHLLQGIASSKQLLALLSLQELYEQSLEREDVRMELYSLSQPGGHPRNWNSVLAACIKPINDITQNISRILSPPSPVKEKADQKAEAADCDTNLHMRRLAPPTGTGVQDARMPPAPPAPTSQILSQVWDKVWESIKKRPAVGWLVREPQDSGLREVFCDGQRAIYAVGILANLVQASIREDRHGVVQKDLSDVLAGLLNLEASIERSRGLVLASPRKKCAMPPDVQLKLELKFAVKSAIYRIVSEFREHILAVDLPPDHRQKILSYHSFKEA